MHAELFYCPYCGEEDLYPSEGEAWYCTSCLRSFVVTFTAFGALGPSPERGSLVPPAAEVHRR